MSVQLGVQGAVRTIPMVSEEARRPYGAARGPGEARDEANTFGLACRDVLDLVRLRMAQRGISWE
jgi:hypothetical protein